MVGIVLSHLLHHLEILHGFELVLLLGLDLLLVIHHLSVLAYVLAKFVNGVHQRFLELVRGEAARLLLWVRVGADVQGHLRLHVEGWQVRKVAMGVPFL